MTSPLVTVCMPTYNYGRYLPQAIRSVLDQSLADFELLIIDDGSTDSTAAVVEPFAAADPRVVFQRNEGNIGMVKNWNLCLQRARGKYIHFLFGDDFFVSPRALERKVAVMEADPEVTLVSSARTIVGDDSAPVGEWSHFAGGTRLPGRDVIRLCLMEDKNLIGEPSAVMFRRDSGRRGFSERYRQLVDLEMWCHLLLQGDFACCAEPLVAFRVHNQQQSAVNARTTAMLHDIAGLLVDYKLGMELGIGPLLKEYLRIDTNFRILKAYSVYGTITKKQAVELISKTMSTSRLYLELPLYRLIKPIVKILIRRNPWLPRTD